MAIEQCFEITSVCSLVNGRTVKRTETIRSMSLASAIMMSIEAAAIEWGANIERCVIIGWRAQ